MNHPERILSMLALSIGIVLIGAGAHAKTLTPELPSRVATSAGAAIGEHADHAPAQRQIGAAVRLLERAALQRDFSSNARELDLLQSAREDLVSAARLACCAQRMRLDDLESDLAHAIARDTSYLGVLVAPDGATFGPQAPTRDQLDRLVMEGQDILRHSPVVHRLRAAYAADSFEWHAPTANAGANQKPGDLAQLSPWSLPYGAPAAAQFRYQF